jgi:Flp pilus assembly secretin CpaC
MLPIGALPNHPMASSVWSPPADLPQPTEQELEAIRDHVEGIVDPNFILDLEQGRTRLLKLKKPARSVQVSGTEVIRCTAVNGREVAIQARTVGTTVLHLTFSDADTAHDVEVRYLVRVFPALAAREPYQAVFQALEAKITEIFPESKVHLKLVGEAILITGQVRDARDATAIVQLVVANTPWADRRATAGTPVGGTGSPHVINQLQIAHAAQHQVTLRVVVVELSRSALWSLCGKGLEVNGSAASPDTKHLAGTIAPVLYEFSDGSISAAGAAMAFSSVKAANVTDGQPMTTPRQILLHGQPATVVASGQCLVTASADKVPVQQRSVTLGLHGIDLKFTPIGVEDESLRMTVAASAGPPGPGRQVNSAVAAVREGKTLVFAGLLPPVAQERDPRRTAAPWRIFDRFAGVEQPTTSMRERIVLILPEAVGTR